MTFERLKVGEIANFFNNNRKPVTKKDRKPGTVPYYGAAGIQDYVAEYIFDGHYVLVGEDGTVLQPGGKPTLQNIKGKSWVNNHAHVIATDNDDDTDFLYYSLGNEDVTAFVTGAVQMKLNMGNLKDVEIYWPSEKRTRSRIVQVLRLMDEKIELNRKTAIQIENIAQTIFKSWFIDFDPVHAKSRGEELEGMDAETAALFPDSFEESELGLIPAGWSVSALSDAVQLISGGTPRTSNAEYWGGDIPWYSVGDVPTSGAYFTTTAKHVSQLGLENSAVNLVETHTTIISARGTVGKVCMAGVPTTFNQSCYGVSGGVSPFYTYLLVSENVPRLLNIAHGGAFDTITRDSFSAISISQAPKELPERFHEIVKPLFEQSLRLAIQNKTLEALRDTLLPRLISGELEIPEELLVD